MPAPRSSPNPIPTARSGALAPPPSSRRPPTLGDILDQALEILTRYVSTPTARSVLRLAQQRKGAAEGEADLRTLVDSIQRGLRLFVRDPAQLRECGVALDALAELSPEESGAIVVVIDAEENIASARMAGRRAAALAGFSPVGVTRLMTAISEVARNIVLYAGNGQVELVPLSGQRGVDVIARDRGPGIPNLDQILAGNYKSRLGMGLGLRGVKKISEQFEVQTAPGRGTVVHFVLRDT